MIRYSIQESCVDMSVFSLGAVTQASVSHRVKVTLCFFVPQLIFEKEGVYLHTNAKRTSEETSIPGFIRIVERVRKTRTFGSVHVLLSALNAVVNTFSQILSSLYP